jgi:predicted ester cyclase
VTELEAVRAELDWIERRMMLEPASIPALREDRDRVLKDLREAEAAERRAAERVRPEARRRFPAGELTEVAPWTWSRSANEQNSTHRSSSRRSSASKLRFPRVSTGAQRVHVTCPSHETAAKGHFTVEEMVAEDDLVMGRFRLEATYRGGIDGTPESAVGKRVGWGGFFQFRFRDGRIVENVWLRDVPAYERSLGLGSAGRAPAVRASRCHLDHGAGDPDRMGGAPVMSRVGKPHELRACRYRHKDLLRFLLRSGLAQLP